MRVTTGFVILVLLAVPVLALDEPPPEAINRVVDTSFEFANVTGWVFTGAAVRTSETAYTGNLSARLGGNGRTSGSFYQDVNTAYLDEDGPLWVCYAQKGVIELPQSLDRDWVEGWLFDEYGGTVAFLFLRWDYEFDGEWHRYCLRFDDVLASLPTDKVRIAITGQTVTDTAPSWFYHDDIETWGIPDYPLGLEPQVCVPLLTVGGNWGGGE